MIDRWPRRIRVTSDGAHTSDIFDAESGERFHGVIQVKVSAREVTVEATINWPVTNADLTALDEAYTGQQAEGVNTETRTYHVKHLELETQ